MRQGWDSELGDPYILEIASRFLEGFERGMAHEQRLIASLDDDTVRRDLMAANPALGQYYEGKTKEELESRMPIMSIAVGVAFALRHATRH
jgi:hypothetical protein